MLPLPASAKTFWEGTHRTRSPGETYALVRPHLATLGITRMADLTGLDRIGIPVISAVRPNRPMLASTSGKGLTREAALASAAMEGLETWAAEELADEDLLGTAQQVSEHCAVIGPDVLPRKRSGILPPQLPLRWSMGWDIVCNSPVAVPQRYVSLHPRVLPEEELAGLPSDSNGLASGNTLCEAISSGLYEVIERDAIALNAVHEDQGRVHEDTAPERVRELLERLRRAGTRALLYDITSDLGVPVYLVQLYDLERRHAGVLCGYGCHLDPEVALLRALTEAVQARVIHISGARDDLLRSDYVRFKKIDHEAAIRQLEAEPATADARRPSEATPTHHGDVQVLIERLQSAGMQRVAVFELPIPEGQLSVVRVVVPGLEGVVSRTYAPGPRARQRLSRPLPLSLRPGART
jgi:ribosomal protein S12 methylthiotransferase accessory factor